MQQLLFFFFINCFQFSNCLFKSHVYNVVPLKKLSLLFFVLFCHHIMTSICMAIFFLIIDVYICLRHMQIHLASICNYISACMSQLYIYDTDLCQNYNSS
ncbi:hypothetical protein EGW08_001402 [Elysia chlorotica]|uniref:Uncharacterized protein n=1 Tax=Elysia chlorotica TaxID=188477 RepID=A0A433UAP2_ELYCH|nr:hypothetical protein EGW08_001402 [Elysia chlorotica]